MTTERTSSEARLTIGALNEGLMLGLVRQHELTEIAELLNIQLQAEIFARRKAEDALVRSEKLASVGRMAAVLAHEINNPLEAVTNVLYLAQTMEGLPDRAREYLSMADSELKRIAHLTRQTLGFYRESTAPARIQVAALFASVCELLRAKVLARRAVVEVQCAPDLAMTAFEGEVRQVLSNLFLNSLDALADGGRVTLRARRTSNSNSKASGGFIRLTIADNGRGIDDASMRQIFEPFFTTKGSVGNGLGLWVSKQIVVKHGGAVQLRSRTDGPYQGTTFCILLPVDRS